MRRFLSALCVGLVLLAAAPAHGQEVRRRVPLVSTPAAPPSTGLKLWLKANALSLSDGDPVASWTDSSGQANHATQGTSGSRPVYKTNIVNSLPVVRFDGTDDFLAFPNFASGFTAGEGILLIKIDADPPGAQAQSGLWQFGTSANGVHLPFTDGVVYEDFGSTVRKTVGNPTPSLASWALYDVASASGEFTARVNNSTVFTTATNTVGFATAPLLGVNTNIAANLDGDVAEFLVYDHVLDSTERAAVVAYINAKYGTSF